VSTKKLKNKEKNRHKQAFIIHIALDSNALHTGRKNNLKNLEQLSISPAVAGVEL